MYAVACCCKMIQQKEKNQISLSLGQWVTKPHNCCSVFVVFVAALLLYGQRVICKREENNNKFKKKKQQNKTSYSFICEML